MSSIETESTRQPRRLLAAGASVVCGIGAATGAVGPTVGASIGVVAAVDFVQTIVRLGSGTCQNFSLSATLKGTP